MERTVLAADQINSAKKENAGFTEEAQSTQRFFVSISPSAFLCFLGAGVSALAKPEERL